MSNPFADDAADARHDTPPKNYGDDPFVMQQNRVIEVPSIEWAGVGLQWVAGPNLRLVDIGRAFSSPDALENMHVVDLRTILAHLDSAAKAIVTELESRGAAR